MHESAKFFFIVDCIIKTVHLNAMHNTAIEGWALELVILLCMMIRTQTLYMLLEKLFIYGCPFMGNFPLAL